jgi:putative ABC transport system permease protein
VRKDVRYALRRLWADPLFTSVAAFTLALGIGAISAVSAIADAALIKAVPFHDAERVLYVRGASQPFAGDRVDWFRQAAAFESLAEYRAGLLTLGGADEPQRISAAETSSEFFAVAGIAPVRGRFFIPDDERVGRSASAVVSASFWKKGGSNPRMLGETLRLESQAYTVVGVAPAGFAFPGRTDVWICRERGRPIQFGNDRGAATSAVVQAGLLGRLAAHGGPEQALAQLGGLQRRQEEIAHGHNPMLAKGSVVQVVPIGELITGDRVKPVLFLYASAVFVLLIACATVTTLQVSRALGRSRELAVRFALGATRPRVIRQLITEHVVLAVCGGALGLFIAAVLISIARVVVPQGVSDFAVMDVSVDGRVFGACAGAVTAATALFGIVSAVQVAHISSMSLRAGTADALPSKNVLRRALVVMEFGLGFLLLLATALTFQTVVRLMALDPGFNASQAIAVDISVPASYGARASSFWDAFLHRLEADRRFSAVGVVDHLPLGLSGGGRQWYEVEGHPSNGSGPDLARWATASVRVVGGDYFRAMGIPLYAGHSTLSPDCEVHCIAVNAAFAERFWPQQPSTGRKLRLLGLPFQVAGVVGNVKGASLTDRSEPQVYFFRPEQPLMDGVAVIRTTADAATVGADIRGYARAVDPNVLVRRMRRMDEVVADSIGPQRFRANLVGVFSAIALTLALAGMGGVSAHTMSQRRREFAIRVALGARASQLVRLALRETVVLIAFGLFLGLSGVPFLVRLTTGLLYGDAHRYPLLLGFVAVLLASAALLVSYVTVRLNMGAQPTTVLKAE